MSGAVHIKFDLMSMLVYVKIPGAEPIAAVGRGMPAGWVELAAASS
jgi:hypothetical protein